MWTNVISRELTESPIKIVQLTLIAAPVRAYLFEIFPKRWKGKEAIENVDNVKE